MRPNPITISNAFIATAALVFLLDQGGLLPLVAIAATIHELGHILAIKALGGRVHRLHLGLAGLCIDYEGRQIGYGGEIVIALAGSLANILLAYGASLWGRHVGSETLFFLAGVSLGACIFNLLPVYQLDGGRAIYCLLAFVFDSEQAYRFVCILSCGTILLLLILGTLLFVWSGWNFTLLTAAGWLLISYCKSRGNTVRYARSS